MSQIKSQGGFTLIELLIVVLIIGILAAIAIPVFNGQRNKAKNSGAKSSLRNAQTAASSIRTLEDNHVGTTATALGGEESALTFTTATAAAPGQVGTPAATADDEPGTNGDNNVVHVVTPIAGDTNRLILTVISTGDKVYSASQANSGDKWVTNVDGAADYATSVGQVD